uniref:Ribosomal protein eL8/eL30/eS12/Gadd45 domain-containing protein n=1 Tax=Otolemur garnettii TaxID=30611 RepID=H0Y1Y2_OTOGA
LGSSGFYLNNTRDINPSSLEVLPLFNGLACGIYKAAKALDKCQARLYVLEANGGEPIDVKLVEPLCAKHQINLIKIDDKKLCLCKTDTEKPQVIGCSCAADGDYGKESQAKDVNEEDFKCKK